MSRVRGWLVRLGNTFRRGRREQDLDAELQAHLDLHIHDNLRQGMTPEEARRVALLRFGGLEAVKEQCRAARRVVALEDVGKDLRYGARMLMKSPSFTAVAVLSLAVGIGVNTAVFSIVDAMLFRSFPYRDPDRLVMLGLVNFRSSNPDFFANPHVADYISWKEQADVFEEMAWSENNVDDTSVASEGHPTQRLRAAVVSTNLFPMLGVEPFLGRGFLPEDAQLGSDDVVLVSYSLWQRRYGADSGAIGQTLWVNQTAATIVGVMPPGYRHLTPRAPDFWSPARNTPADALRRVHVSARLAPGVTLAQAQAAMDTVAAQRAEAFPETNAGWGVRLVPLHEHLTEGVRQRLFVLWGAVGFVLLIACSNVAGVLLARAFARTTEIATRLALGASRWRVARLFLTEGVLLALAGGALGSLLAYGGVQLIRLFNPDANPLGGVRFLRLDEASVDGRVLGYTLLLSLLTALLFSAAPALVGSAPALDRSLQAGGSGATTGTDRQWLRGMLVVAQVALALVLLTGAGLMVSTMHNLATVDPGFQTTRLLTFRLQPRGNRYQRDAAAGETANPVDVSPTQNSQTAALGSIGKIQLKAQVDAFHARVLRRVRMLPGVESAAGIHILPLSHGGDSRLLALDGHPAPLPDQPDGWIRPSYRAVMGNYFAAMGIPLLQGRAFTDRDVAEAPWVAIISRTMANTYWPNVNPIGQHLRVVGTTFGRPVAGERPRTIVGVVEDVHGWSLQQLNPEPAVYVPAVQQSPDAETPNVEAQMSYVVRSAVDPMSLAPEVERVVAEIDPDQPLFDMAPMSQLVAIWTDIPRFYTLLLVAFAGVALVLSVAGIYGVMAYAVTRRTHEIGIRMALGAARGQIGRLVAGQGLALGTCGVALGLVGSFWLTRLMPALKADVRTNDRVLYGVTARDPATFAVASLLLVGAVLLACYGPTRRATKVDPITALRHE